MPTRAPIEQRDLKVQAVLLGSQKEDHSARHSYTRAWKLGMRIATFVMRVVLRR